MTSVPTLKLNTGASIPVIGLGTWQSGPDEVINAVEHALKNGYRHIDCAWMYGNEEQVGEGIRRAGVPRAELFVTSKLWSTKHNQVEAALDDTLKKLGLEYLDLFLMHWPVALNPNGNHPTIPTRSDGTRDLYDGWSIAQTWAQLEAVHRSGKARAIGLSNASRQTVEKILAVAQVKPAVDQLELHLYNPDPELVTWLQSQGIVVEAYSPLGSTGSPLLKDEVVVKIAEKHGVGAGDVLLQYLLSKNIVVLPKSVTPARISSNLTGPLKVKLDDADIKALDGLAPGGKQQRFVMPPWPVDLGFGPTWTKKSW
ncbi:Aldo/keto reductase [Auriculariales sp. MPI-PUGE-AT-0066]|nr:Aldo/keto reductase [Auriculariales sp. MPI-PUGE-AT-0066]